VSQVEKLDSAFSAFLNQISSCTLIWNLSKCVMTTMHNQIFHEYADSGHGA
jgi:hypothetical protein